MIFKILAILVLILFYTIYFVKAIIQKRKGIQTRQLGKVKKAKNIELLLSIATYIIIPIQLLSIIFNYNFITNNIIRYISFFIGIIGNIIFLISIITMQDSWRAGIPKEDKTELISNGIYKTSRNPAFLGFDLMYISICLLFCNYLTIIFSLFAIIMLHLQILQEEKWLENTFKEDYIKYKQKVNRYLGRR